MLIVTGGAGFIGANLVAALADRYPGEVVVVDRLGDGDKWRNLATPEIADIVDPSALAPFIDAHHRAIEAVFHLGAISSTTVRDADAVIEANFRASMELWAACTRHRLRLIYASSAATYGDGSAGFVDDPEPAALARLRPLNLYGWSKHLFDRRAVRLAADPATRPPQWAGLKFFNVYGPHERHKGPMRSVVVQAYEQAVAGEPVRLFRSHRADVADGGQARDFVYVGDAVAVMLWLLDHPEVSGLYNCGSGRARSFLDLAGAVFAALGRAPEIVFIDTPPEIRPRYQYFTEADTRRLRAAGYDRPFVELEKGVSETVRHYLDRDRA